LLADGTPDKARAGETFGEFVEELAALGYRSEWRVLCAADYGAPTIRKRLFLIARRDGLPICWPEPTHGPGRALPWRTAACYIDWSLPCPSIFGRKRPLADATCRRIAAGIVRYVLGRKPFVAWGSMVDGAERSAHVFAFLAKHYGGVVGSDLRAPLGTITAQDHHSLVAVRLGSEAEAQRDNGRRVAVFLTSYYSGGGTASDLRQPLPTVVTHDRHGLVTVALDGIEHRLVDIGMRMLAPRELARAQGFPDSFRLDGTKTQQIARIGNSVCPAVAAALVSANAGELIQEVA
jgi:DNA (cytosine-5)-methyltransferase 1